MTVRIRIAFVLVVVCHGWLDWDSDANDWVARDRIWCPNCHEFVQLYVVEDSVDGILIVDEWEG